MPGKGRLGFDVISRARYRVEVGEEQYGDLVLVWVAPDQNTGDRVIAKILPLKNGVRGGEVERTMKGCAQVFFEKNRKGG